MKKLLLLIGLIPFYAYSQSDSTKFFKDTIQHWQLPVDSTGTIVYKVIEEMPNIPKKDLYARAKVWTALNFKSAKDVIQLDDDEKSSLIVKGVSIDGNIVLHFSIHFTFKDYKYRIIISQFTVEETEISGYPVAVPHILNYYPSEDYKALKEWNWNVKTGNMEFNRQIGITRHQAKQKAFRVNLVGVWGDKTIAEIKEAMLQSAKGDDF